MSTFFGIFCPPGNPNYNISFQKMTVSVKNGSVTIKNQIPLFNQ
jgi:hypothetical protein